MIHTSRVGVSGFEMLGRKKKTEIKKISRDIGEYWESNSVNSKSARVYFLSYLNTRSIKVEEQKAFLKKKNNDIRNKQSDPRSRRLL